MKKLIERFLQIGCALFLVCALAPVNAFSQVSVYAEGAYTETDLAVYIYTDITAPTELRSAGVKLTYVTSELIFASAEKNDVGPDGAVGTADDVWALGTESYMNPENSSAGEDGEVVIILGKLNTEAASVGVSGDRVLLGRAKFTHTGLTSFTLGLELGKEHPNHPTDIFANFVDTESPANVLDDSIVFGEIKIRERGDANADGSVTPADMIAVRNAYYGGAPLGCEPAADCNDDAVLPNIYPNITPADMICIRNKYYTSP